MGKKPDYKIYKKNNHSITPKEVDNVLELCFLGVEEKDYLEQISSLPVKKRNQDLILEEKEYNRIHSKKRIVIEHTIYRIKKYRIMNYIFRNRLRKYDTASNIVSGLVNYRIMNPFLSFPISIFILNQ